MRHDRRGLTVIGLVLILLAVGIAIVLLLRLVGRDDAAAPAPAAGDTLAIPSSAAAPLVDRLDLAVALDTVAAAGDTLVVRLRASGAGAGVARATIDLEAGAGSTAIPTSLVTNDIGEATARWAVGADAGARTLRATVRGNPAATLEATVRVTDAPAAGAQVPDAR